jgi:hypothetical protein
MHRIRGIITLSIFVLILSACGDLSTGSGKSSEPKLPEATITIDGKAVSYKKGTYCWKTSDQGMCVDKAGAYELTKDSAPLVVTSNSTIKISYEEQPSELFVRVLKDGKVHQQTNDDYELQVPSEQGTYIYDIFARWKKKGDLALAFKIEIQ